MLIVVNYAPHQSQCYLKFHFTDLVDIQWRLQDLMSEAVYDRNGSDLQMAGLYLDMHPWQFHVFEMKELNGDF